MRPRRPVVRAVFLAGAAVIASGALASAAGAGEGGGGPAQPAGAAESAAARDEWHGRIELKRQATARGTPEETTQTTLRIETFFDGPVSVLRVDFPLPDKKTDFEGDPFDPGMGDIRVRLKFRPFPALDHALSSFVEATFPTADPEDLGSGKYQLSAALRMLVPVTLPVADPASYKALFEIEAQQVNSVGGDPERKDINYTKFEFTLQSVWRREYQLKLKLKPSVDWEQNGKTAAVAEVEGGLFFARHWRTWLMLGRRISGPSGVPGTYSERVEFGIAYTF